MSTPTLKELRGRVDATNQEILALLNERLALVEQIKLIKEKSSSRLYSPEREAEMLDQLMLANEGPLTADRLRHIFKEIFKLALEHMKADTRGQLHVHRGQGDPDKVYSICGHSLGGQPELIAGPCSVESLEQTDRVARHLKELGVSFLRGGAYKPRTSPYSFQGLGVAALKILREVADRYDLAVVTEILDPRHYEQVAEYCDVFQVGTRNMYNYELLRLLGQANKPVLLKRGFMATLEEFILAAEYVAKEGNQEIILCERGIRTHERWTRNTIDVSAIPLLRIETPFPVIVDVSHGTGRKDIMIPMAKAALAAGAQGIMAEVHPTPALALSDNTQQMDLDELSEFHAAVFSD